LPCTPAPERLARTLVFSSRSRTNTSRAWLVSPATRFVARLSKATSLPSREMRGFIEVSFEFPPEGVTLTHTIEEPVMSRTKMSARELLSFATRFDASLWKATKRPFPESAG
jgi:hypothetical protein